MVYPFPQITIKKIAERGLEENGKKMLFDKSRRFQNER